MVTMNENEPGHTYNLLVAKVELTDKYNFTLKDIHGSTFNYNLVSIPLNEVELYKDALRTLLKTTDLPIEYRGFD